MDSWSTLAIRLFWLYTFILDASFKLDKQTTLSFQTFYVVIFFILNFYMIYCTHILVIKRVKDWKSLWFKNILFAKISHVLCVKIMSVSLRFYFSLPWSFDYLYAGTHMLAIFPFSMKWKRNLRRCAYSE